MQWMRWGFETIGVLVVLALLAACQDPAPAGGAGGTDAGLAADGRDQSGPLCPEPACPAEGTRACTGGKIRSCALDPVGCLTWGNWVQCPTGTCAGSAACAGCKDTCAAGATECKNNHERRCQTDDKGCLVWGPVQPCASGACASATTCVPQQGGDLVWLLHLSDLHFGGSATVGATLNTFFKTVLPVVKPGATVTSGDSVENGGSAWAWGGYVSATAKAPPYPTYFEVPGNHDLKNNGAAAYLASSSTGKAQGGLYGQSMVTTSAGKLRIIRTNTADTATNPVNIAGFFGDKQAQDLLALPQAAGPIAHAIVVGHHPMTGVTKLQLLGSDVRMQQVIDHFQAEVYLCGHVHAPAIAWLGQTLVVQAASLGKSTPPSFMLVALDPAGPTAREIPLPATGVSWPIVMVTAPAHAGLGGVNPHAVTHTAGGQLEVRALVFAPDGVAGTEVRLGGGPWAAMSATGSLWTATVALPGSPGVHPLEVRAGNTVDKISIAVGP